MALTLREKLHKDLLLLDGAFGTYLASSGQEFEGSSSHGGCMEYLSISSPKIVSGIHADYLEAGADAVETNTFGGNVLKLGEYGLAERSYEINLAAVKIARKEADRFSTPKWPRYVIGTMGPTGKLPSSTDAELGNISYVELKDIFYAQARAIIDGGADAVLIETGQDMLEMKAAVNGARRAMLERKKDIVIFTHSTLANNGRMLLGTEVSAFMAVMGNIGSDVIGLNCSTGPVEMESAIAVLSAGAPCFVSCVPNAGLPVEDKGKTVFPLSPEEMADIMSDLAVKYRLDVVGGCCGTTPGHIKAIRKKTAKYSKRRIPQKNYYASSYRGFDPDVKPRPIKVGERMNTQGSRKMKAMLEREDYDGIVDLGKIQEKQGSDALDLCVALTERSTEMKDAVILTRRLAESVEVPLMIDSTDADVVEKALECYPGAAFINSANLEDGGEKARRIFSLAKEHGSFVVCLSIDEKGMAVTVDKKVEVAGRIYKMATEEFAMEPGRLIFDLLTFTLGTGEEEYRSSARDTMDAIRILKEKYPGVLAILGVSNVSFGLSGASRKVLNMVFLEEALKAGLDMAIVNGADYIPAGEIDKTERILAEKLIFSEGPEALAEFAEHFSHKNTVSGPVDKKVTSEGPIEKRIIECVLNRNSSGILPLVDEALKTYSADAVISEILMESMKQAGDRLDKGEMVLPYVLQAAEVMKKAVGYLEKDLSDNKVPGRGKVILATVEGDVHDIGKNLVKMLLVNNGFSVIDLGKQVSVQEIIERAKKEKPDAIGLSALLVSTSRHMRTCVKAMHEAGLEYPIMVGGAPVNENFAGDIARVAENDLYRGGVFYAKDAFTGLRIMKALVEKSEKSRILAEYHEKNRAGTGIHKKENIPPSKASYKENGFQKRPGKIKEPPFYGVRAVSKISADDVLEYLDKKFLFEVSWGGGIKDGKEKERLIKGEYEPVLKKIKEDAIRKGWLDLKAVYGYFRCRIDGTKMSVIGVEGEELTVFDLKPGKDGRGIADHFEREDIVVFQAVTIGDKVTKAIGDLIDREENSRAFYLHGFSVNLAEALAEYVHNRVRKELGLGKDQGKRYSPGYPIWKELEDQKKIFKLLDVTKRIGISLTQDYQMVPEQSTTAIIVHK
ncbi:MAG: homocysteine S-methyltransferase family protein [Candidatus Omnitrophota bacterium]